MKPLTRYAYAAMLPLAGCSDSAEKSRSSQLLGQSAQAMKYDFWQTDPASLPITVNPFGTGAPAGTGTVPQSPGQAVDNANTCNRCTFTVSDRSTPTTHVSTATSPETYAATLWNHGGNNSLRSRFTASIPGARNQFNAAYASNLANTINSIETFLKDWGNVDEEQIHVSKPPPTAWFRAFKPTQTRMRAVENGVFWHPDPFALEELRYRGARSYCAMRETARQQDLTGKYSQGKSAGSSFLEWKVGDAESTVAIGRPLKDVSSPIANVFVIPIAVGSNITPIHGPLVPATGPIVHPISWMTADSILISHEDGGRNVYVNSQHADAFLGQRVTGSITTDELPLFKYGFIDVRGGFIFDAEFGTLLSVNGGGTGITSELTRGRGDASGPSPRRTVKLDRWNGAHYRPSAVATDAPLLFDAYAYPVEDDGGLENSFLFHALPGYRTRIRSDDDRSLTVQDRIREKLSVFYRGGFTGSFGPLSITLTIGGESALDLTLHRLTTIREHVSGVSVAKLQPPIPDITPPVPGGVNFTGQSNVLVVPETKKDFSIQPLIVKANIHLEASIGPFDFEEDYEQQILKLGSINLGSNATQIGRESSRLRVGTFTDFGIEYVGDPAHDFRSTYSHLPHPTISSESAIPSFASFPDDGIDTVGACISNTSTPPGDPPPPTGPIAPTAVKNKLCVYGPTCPATFEGLPRAGGCPADLWQIPSNICSPGAIASYLAARGVGGGMATCLTAVLGHLCDPTVSPQPRVQSWGGLRNVIARSVVLAADGTPSRIIQIQSQCIDAMESAVSTREAAKNLADLVEGMFHYGICDASWRILGEQAL